ncbi:MAG: phosphatase PAP2 family protein [Lachnospiraceae bacterium]|nr:phosphatase PAP2 family protein [Lachnospiraceae bacterium]
MEWLDYTVLDMFLDIRNPVLTPIMKLFTIMGEGGAVWIVTAVLLLLFRQTRKVGITVALALIFCLLAGNVLLKNVIARPRPCWRHQEIEMLIAEPKDFSFPSGHTMAAFAAAISIFLWDRRWGLAAVLGAVIIALSRMYFYVHYPTDVLAGAVFGVVMGILSVGVVHAFENRRKQC